MHILTSVSRDCPDVAATIHNIGVVYRKLGRYEEALVQYGEAQEVYVAVYGHMHLDTAKAQENMVIVYSDQGKLEKALEIYNSILQTKIRVCCDDSSHVADTKNNMALLHKERSETAAAKELFLECEAIYTKVFGEGHSKTTDAAQQARDCQP